MRKSISEVGLEDFVKAGLTIEEAREFQRVLKEAVFGAKGSDPREVWRSLVAQRVLKPWHPHGLHQLVYYSVYANWDSLTNGPPLYWFPSLYDFALSLIYFSQFYPSLISNYLLLSLIHCIVFSVVILSLQFCIFLQLDPQFLSFLFNCLVIKKIFLFGGCLRRLCEKLIETLHLTGPNNVWFGNYARDTIFGTILYHNLPHGEL